MVKRKRNRGAGRAQAFLSRVDGTQAGAAGGEATVCAGRVSPPGTLLAQPRRRDEAPTGVTAPGPRGRGCTQRPGRHGHRLLGAGAAQRGRWPGGQRCPSPGSCLHQPPPGDRISGDDLGVSAPLSALPCRTEPACLLPAPTPRATCSRHTAALTAACTLHGGPRPSPREGTAWPSPAPSPVSFPRVSFF